jgi:hypothetical protein
VGFVSTIPGFEQGEDSSCLKSRGHGDYTLVHYLICLKILVLWPTENLSLLHHKVAGHFSLIEFRHISIPGKAIRDCGGRNGSEMASLFLPYPDKSFTPTFAIHFFIITLEVRDASMPDQPEYYTPTRNFVFLCRLVSHAALRCAKNRNMNW